MKRKPPFKIGQTVICVNGCLNNHIGGPSQGEKYTVLGCHWQGYGCGSGWMIWFGTLPEASGLSFHYGVVDSGFFKAVKGGGN